MLYLYSPGSKINDLTFAQSKKTPARSNDLTFRPFGSPRQEENRLLKAMGLRAEEKFRILPDNELEEPEARSFGPLATSLKADWSNMAKKVELDEPMVDLPFYWERLDLQKNIDEGLIKCSKMPMVNNIFRVLLGLRLSAKIYSDHFKAFK